jgi:hypothetical protein
MTKRLSGPLGSYADRDEFQIGQTLVWVKYPPNQNRVSLLSRAEELFPVLEFDISKVEELATKAIGSSISASVIGITIEPDSSASYMCTFFDGEYEDEFISVNRMIDGSLVAVRT